MTIKEYIRNVDRAVLNAVWENTVRRFNKCLETGGGTFWTLNVTLCIVIIRCTENFWSTCIKLIPYRAVNTLHLGYKNQSFYAVSGTSRCLFSDKYKTYTDEAQTALLKDPVRTAL